MDPRRMFRLGIVIERLGAKHEDEGCGLGLRGNDLQTLCLPITSRSDGSPKHVPCEDRLTRFSRVD
jgi:hypothetical protein